MAASNQRRSRSFAWLSVGIDAREHIPQYWKGTLPTIPSLPAYTPAGTLSSVISTGFRLFEKPFRQQDGKDAREGAGGDVEGEVGAEVNALKGNQHCIKDQTGARRPGNTFFQCPGDGEGHSDIARWEGAPHQALRHVYIVEERSRTGLRAKLLEEGDQRGLEQ